MNNFLRDISIMKRPTLKVLFFMFSDAVLIFFSVFLAFMVRFEGGVPSRYFVNVYGIIFLTLLITLPIFYFSKLYHFTWAYVSADELISLVKATGLSFLLLAAAFLVLRDHVIFSGFPRSTLFITYFFIFILCGGIRFAKRVYLQIFQTKGEKEKTLIVGAGDAGEQILRSILSSRNSGYLPVGFIDDNPAKRGVLIHGLRVMGKISDMPNIIKEKNVENLIVALPSAGSRAIKLAVEAGRKSGVRKIKVVPAINELIAGEVSIGQLREVEMEDLLGREPVSLDKKSIENFVCGKRILITGAAGSIGSELSRQIVRFKPASILLLDQDETGIFSISQELKNRFPRLQMDSVIADIREEEKMERIFKKFRPQVVFHAAAYKHVPLMEENADEAVKNNVFGTRIMAQSALRSGTEKFVFISTDKAVNPVSIMGATKRMGEMLCQIANKKNRTKFVSVRFGNVLDSRGSVIPIFREQIKRGGPVEVTHPQMKRYFMTTPEACLLVLQAGAMGQGGEVFVLDMGEPVKILDLAKEMIRLSGFEPDKEIPIVFTEKRPGEKFFEEILTAEEGTLATRNQKIFIAKLHEINERSLNRGLKKLKGAQDKKAVTSVLKEIIPSYRHGKEV